MIRILAGDHITEQNLNSRWTLRFDNERQLHTDYWGARDTLIAKIKDLLWSATCNDCREAYNQAYNAILRTDPYRSTDRHIIHHSFSLEPEAT